MQATVHVVPPSGLATLSGLAAWPAFSSLSRQKKHSSVFLETPTCFAEYLNMTRLIRRKTKSSLTQASKAMKPSSERLTNKPISDFATLALSRYAAGLPLNIKQLEIVIGISRAAIYRLGSKGPPFVQADGRGSRLYHPKAIEKWLAKNSHPKTTTKKIEDNQHGQR